MARRAGADAILFVSDANLQGYAAGRGVGVALRKLPGIDSHVIVRAHVAVDLLDKSDERIAGALGGDSPLIKGDLVNVTGDIESVKTPEARARLSEEMRKQLRQSLDLALAQMGE